MQHSSRPRHGPGPGAWIAGLIALAACVGPTGVDAAAPSIPLARDVDLARLYGGWHIVATIPNSFERGMVAPYDVYAPRPDGSIREDFYVRRGAFAAPLKHFVVRDFIKPGTGGAFWQVQIIWPLRLPFLLLYVDPAYRYVIFGEDSRKLGWIYAREATLSDAEYEAAFARLAALGYNPLAFRKIIQTPDQIGKPGFWNDGVRPSPGAQDPPATGASHDPG
jgi:apolipoprotein D and lipocalin family protein